MADVNYSYKCDQSGCNFELSNPRVSEIRREARGHIIKVHGVAEPDPADIDARTQRTGV